MKGVCMHIQDLILLVIGSEDGACLQGRTILQKKLYFLSVLNKTDHCDDLVFRPHYYGPYSREVAENLDILASSSSLDEETETFSTDRNVLGEIRRHSYSLARDGEIVRDEITKQRECASWQKVLDELNSQPAAHDFNTLSIAAKVHYIINRQHTATPEEIRKVARELGWKLNQSQIENVFSFLESLSLISVEESD